MDSQKNQFQENGFRKKKDSGKVRPMNKFGVLRKVQDFDVWLCRAWETLQHQ